MDNKDKQKQLDLISIEEKTNRAFFFGYIIAFIPFIILSLINFNNSFKMILMIFGIITSLINAFIYKNLIQSRLSSEFNIKYKKNN